MGTYLKVRQDDRIVSVAAIIAVTANTDGHRVIIGLGLGPSEVENFSKDFLCGLKARGLDGAKLVISDAHSGLRASVKRVFKAAWQRLSRSWDAKCSRPCLPRPAHRRPWRNPPPSGLRRPPLRALVSAGRGAARRRRRAAALPGGGGGRADELLGFFFFFPSPSAPRELDETPPPADQRGVL